MNSTELKSRTKSFAIKIVRLAQTLPNNRVGWTFSSQIVRSGTSIAANYRAVCRAKSDRDFASKLDIVLEEADETLFWLEMIEELSLVPEEKSVIQLKSEANELVSIFAASVKTAKQRLNKR